jgi:hypothetical protein
MGAGNPRKAVKLAGKGIRPGDAVSKRKFAKQEESALPLGVPGMVERQGQQPGYGLVSDPGMLGRASHGAPEFEHQLLEYFKKKEAKKDDGSEMSDKEKRKAALDKARKYQDQKRKSSK